MKLVTVAEMKAIEKEADQKGVSYAEMMERAGNGVAEWILQKYGCIPQKSILGLVGSGNNGGDALVALGRLAEQDWQTAAYLVRSRPEHDELLARFLRAGGVVYKVETDPNGEKLRHLLNNSPIVLDGILGTGVQLPLKPELDQVLTFIKSHLGQAKVVAVDCPSGVDCDNGAAAENCLPADLTICMEAVKRGLLAFPANDLVGELVVIDLGLPEGLTSSQSVRFSTAEPEQIRAWLPIRARNAHKGTFGTALIAAGSINYTGAAYLAAEAAYRVGAGLVQLAVPGPLHTALAGSIPEATWVILPHEMGVIAAAAADVLRKNLGRATVLVIGPGLGVESPTAEFVARLFTGGRNQAKRHVLGFVGDDEPILETANKLPPLIVDADGLRLMAKLPGWSSLISSDTILTPHPGEMSALTGLPVQEIQNNRLVLAQKYAQEWNKVLVLKGAMTCVANPDGEVTVIPVATSALAKAGTGDVLAGCIAGLRAQGMAAYQAAVAGAWIHAQAGLMAEKKLGNSASVLSRDIVLCLAQVFPSI